MGWTASSRNNAGRTRRRWTASNGNEQELPALAGYAREGARHTDGIRAWDSIWLGGGQ